MAAALRVLGLPAVRDPKLSVEVEKLTGYLAVGLDGHTALERTLAESQYDTLDALRAALILERERLIDARALTGEPDPDLASERVREVAALLHKVLELPHFDAP